jgi:hypothetical protein
MKGKTMKNKLLITSALVAGGLTLSSIANAEISGHMRFGYAFTEGKSNDATAAGTQGFNKETQIDMSTSGELSNGMGFKAGASFEAEGNYTDTNGTSRDDIDDDEGVFIELAIAEGTRLHFGMDKFNNLDDNATPVTGTALTTITDAGGDSGSDRNPSSPYGSFGIGLAQATPFGEISALYVPQNGDVGNASNHTSTNIEGKMAYEIKFKGNLGVEGLNVVAGLNERKLDLGDEAQGTKRDGEGSVYGASYNFGSVAIGASKMKDDKETGVDKESTEYGVTFAVNDAVSIGLGKMKTEQSDKTVDVDATIATVGYNLGPIAVEFNYADVENHGFTAGDVTGGSIQTVVKF